MAERASLADAPGVVVQPATRAAPRPIVAIARDRAHLVALAVMVVLIGAHLIGVDGMMPLGMVVNLVSVFVGLRIHRPAVRWPWWALAVASVAAAAAGAVGLVVEPYQDLTASRSFAPTLLSFPGYVIAGVALLGFVRARAGVRRSEVIDSVLVSLAALILVYELLVVPALGMDAWPPALVAVLAFPVVTSLLLGIGIQLAFSSEGRAPAFLLLVGVVASLHVGEMLYAIGELQLVDIPLTVSRVPYLLVSMLCSAAVLHPSMRGVARMRSPAVAGLPFARVALVAAAVTCAPIVLVARVRSWDIAGTAVVGSIVGIAAIARLVDAMGEGERAAARVYHRATHDGLTGLPNRTSLIATLGTVFEERTADRVTVAIVDIDGFRRINDTFGHRTGDVILRSVASRLRAVLRAEDHLYRTAGDEFVVLLTDTPDADVRAVAERLRDSVRRPIRADEHEVDVTVSIGLASATTHDTGRADQLLQEADVALNRGRRSGPATVTRFDPRMLAAIERRVWLERHLRRALHEGSLGVAYQPIVAGPRPDVVGFEALARWSIDGIPVGPDEFVAVAEDAGLTAKLGSVVLDRACGELARWRRDLPGMADATMSVNVSTRQLAVAGFVDTVAAALDRHDLAGDALWLEITESAMMEDPAGAVAVLHDIRALGVRLAIDDFGTGFSSLAYLKRLPVSRVKVDRTFVDGITSEESDRSVVAAVVAMARAFGLDVVAEGVERPEQARALLDLGCPSMQGYLFGRPVPADAVAELVAERVAGLGDRRWP